MPGKFAFSFDRETYRGAFDSRSDALAGAYARLRGGDDSVTTIYVAQWVPGDEFADHHAEPVLDAMRTRARRAAGDASFLAPASEQQLADLDEALAKTISAWLARHARVPKPTRLRGVSEHAVALVPTHAPDGDAAETHTLGPEA